MFKGIPTGGPAIIEIDPKHLWLENKSALGRLVIDIACAQDIVI